MAIENIAYIGIGSNMEGPLEQCEKAVSLLEASPHLGLTKKSSFYETEPVGPVDQDWFVNAVVEVKTSLNPFHLLHLLNILEQDMGRTREEPWGPRIIDLDLLFYGNSCLNTERLKIPHPEIGNRRFVLEPLAEITSSFIHPQSNKPIGELLADLPDTPVCKKIPASNHLA